MAAAGRVEPPDVRRLAVGALGIDYDRRHTSLLLQPLIRSNSDICRSKLSRGQLEQLWLATVCINKKDFVALSEALGGHNYQFLVLDQVVQNTREPEDYSTVVRDAEVQISTFPPGDRRWTVTLSSARNDTI